MHATLQKLGVDERTMKQVFLTIQRFGDDGVDAVQGIVDNALSKWDRIDNMSAFITSSCIKFRRAREQGRQRA